jgi:formylglycine-generating enzyme required for sulfatase activity
MPRLCSFLLSLLIASAASAVTMDWTPIANPGNACDPQFGGSCRGGVGYAYEIGTYEVTNSQYTEFLNAIARSDPNGLYSSNQSGVYGGIARSGTDGSYTYNTLAGRDNLPVNFVSFWDAVRFANWLNNGQPMGAQGPTTTENGAYTLTPQGIANNSVSRNASAQVVIPSHDEWYKAAYYDSSTSNYFFYPTGSDATIECSAPNAAPNQANCRHHNDPANPQGPTNVGSYSGSSSPYGTFDQGGNVNEWFETIYDISGRGNRGGNWIETEGVIVYDYYRYDPATMEKEILGFRLAMIPEPSTGLLVIAGLLGLGGWRRIRP